MGSISPISGIETPPLLRVRMVVLGCQQLGFATRTELIVADRSAI